MRNRLPELEVAIHLPVSCGKRKGLWGERICKVFMHWSLLQLV